MASTADIVERVADRHVKRLTGPLESALRRGASRISESALTAALASGSRERAIRLVEHAIEDDDLRVLAVRMSLDDRLLDVAQESADATRCAVRPTTTPAQQAMRSTPAADAATQVAVEASEQAARALIGNNTVPVTADMQRAIDRTPLRLPRELPSAADIEQALSEAANAARFDRTGARVQSVDIASLRPTKRMLGDSELIVRYRQGLDVPPIVVNQNGVILDGHERAASAWVAGLDRIPAVIVTSEDEAALMEWLRWNN